MTDTRLRELYEETVASQLKVWDDEIEHFDARADIVMAQFEDKYYCLLKTLRTKEHEVRVRLERLREECDEHCWEEIRADLLSKTEDMKAALEHASEEIDLTRA
jgi:cytochrome c556